MGVVIRGPWPAHAQRAPAREVRQLIAHELILVKKFEDRRKALERQSVPAKGFEPLTP